MKHEIYFVIKYNELLVECTIKMKLVNSCPNLSTETIFLNTENSKTTEPHKFILKLSQRIYLKSSNKHVALHKLAYLAHLKKYKTTVQKQYTQKNSSNVEWWFWVALRFLLSVRYSTSYWIHHKKTKKHCLLTILFIYIKKINNRLVFKIKRWI